MRFEQEQVWRTCRERNDAYNMLTAAIGACQSMEALEGVLEDHDTLLDRFKRGDAEGQREQHGFKYHDAIHDEINRHKAYLKQRKDFDHGF